MDIKIITIDGPAGVGKTTLAKRMAEYLDVAYLDTGAMYRALAWFIGEDCKNVQPEPIRELLKDLVFDLQGSGQDTRIILNGKFLDGQIRTEEVGMRASDVAQMPVVREYMKKVQQELGHSMFLVAEGRDMGTTVFPWAECKFFLEASPQIRARRRYEQLLQMGRDADLQVIESAIAKRDRQDRNRAVAPLRPAEDAHIIDTGNKNIDEVFAAMLLLVD
ncbi:MAG: (d)CMP kinase [Thermodesulfobacteriota bacterium]